MPSSPTPPFRRLSVPIRNRWGDGEMALLDFGDPERAPDLVFVHANGFNAGTYRRLYEMQCGADESTKVLEYEST